jgi:hypothetical protein
MKSFNQANHGSDKHHAPTAFRHPKNIFKLPIEYLIQNSDICKLF